MQRIYFKIIMSFISLCLCFIDVQGQKDIPSYLTKAVRIIRSGGGGGSGFYYHLDSATYLVTSAHVLYVTINDTVQDKLRDTSIELLSYNTELSNDNSTRISIKLNKSSVIFKDLKKDICAIPIGVDRTVRNAEIVISLLYNVKALSSSININGFDSKLSLDINNISPGDNIILIGYPSTLDTKIRAKVYDFKFPLIQSGIISGISKTYGNIIISGPVFGGNSGGAVMAKNIKITPNDKTIDFDYVYNLIGIVCASIPTQHKAVIADVEGQAVSNSGYSVIIPIQYVDDLIKHKKIKIVQR